MYLSVVGALYGCDMRKKETALQLKVDSLRTELETSHQTAKTLQEIGTLIDSIDANRHLLRTRMVEGTTFEDYTARLQDISKYVKETQQRIAVLENKLSSSKNSYSSYTGSINRLKKELETRSQELAVLQEQVTKYRNENENLVQTVNLQKAEIADKLGQLEVKQQEIAKLETNVKELITQSKVDEGEAYFARGQALELAANRTRFAPRKKRNTRMEAIELYKKAASYGKEEAQAKITELEKKI